MYTVCAFQLVHDLQTIKRDPQNPADRRRKMYYHTFRDFISLGNLVSPVGLIPLDASVIAEICQWESPWPNGSPFQGAMSHPIYKWLKWLWQFWIVGCNWCLLPGPRWDMWQNWRRLVWTPPMLKRTQVTGRIQNPSKSHQNRLIEVATHLRLQKVLHVPKHVPLKMLLDVKSIKVLHSDCRSLCWDWVVRRKSVWGTWGCVDLFAKWLGFHSGHSLCRHGHHGHHPHHPPRQSYRRCEIVIVINHGDSTWQPIDHLLTNSSWCLRLEFNAGSHHISYFVFISHDKPW